ncbi:MAG TPA: thioredoxin, partial [Nitrososphaeraceae archaeon]|nr:thioredoxin [Nitrososphaeraceae archaeon]
IRFTNSMLQHFWDDKDGNLYFTSDDHEQLIVRTKSLYDLAIPSGNSVAASNLLRLYYLTENNDYLDKAERIMKAGARTAAENPFGFGQLLVSIYLYIKKPVEIIIIRNVENKHDSPMLTWLNRQFVPNGIIATVNGNLQLEELQKYPFFMNRIPSSKEEKGKSVAEYALVCRNFTCSLPIYSIQDLELHIANTPSS